MINGVKGVEAGPGTLVNGSPVVFVLRWFNTYRRLCLVALACNTALLLSAILDKFPTGMFRTLHTDQSPRQSRRTALELICG